MMAAPAELSILAERAAVVVRFAYAAHAAPRNAFNAVGANVPDDARPAAARRSSSSSQGGRTAAGPPCAPSSSRADEARGLLATL